MIVLFQRAALAAAVLAFVSCSPMPSGPTVHRTAANEAIDLSGEWNDVDSRLVSEEMVKDMLGRTWIDEFREGEGGKPKLVVGHVANRSHDHIPVDTFIKDLERELINSGEVRFMASHGQRGQLGREKEYQARAASLESQKAMGRELGADFLLMGQINSIIDQAGGITLKYYQIELELIHIETGEKVWIGQKKIKKVIERGRWGY